MAGAYATDKTGRVLRRKACKETPSSEARIDCDCCKGKGVHSSPRRVDEMCTTCGGHGYFLLQHAGSVWVGGH